MKKFVTIMLVAMLAISALFVLAACGSSEPLAREGAYYLLAGGLPGWGLEGVNPDDASVANRVMEAISVKDERVASIKSELKDVKYLYLIQYEFKGSAGWTNTFQPEADAEITNVDGALLVKVILYTSEDVAGKIVWTPTWYSSPEAAGETKSLTPSTLWTPPFKDGISYGTDGSGWNSNGVLLEGEGTYYIVFAEFNSGSYGMAAIKA